MHRRKTLVRIVVICAVLVLAGAAGASGDAEGDRPEEARSAPLLDGLGDLHHEIETDSELAQRYFDQGLVLAWAFNHGEAERSFREAASLDPECAMCWWGVAWVLGPNINAAMEEVVVPEAWEALQRARKLLPEVSPRERAYIEALTERYAPEPVDDRSSLDRAFARAMGEVAQQFPNDLDAAVLHAEALMDTTPWDYWKESGAPKPVTERILTTLESVLERAPDHPAANHLYIHAVEAVHPERGLAAAERLEDLVPGAGHLVHMPSHIYIRVGRYRDAVAANIRAVDADRAYVTQCHAQGVYPLAYVPHNHHFLWASASLAGQSDVAVDAAYQVAARVDTTKLREPGYGTLQHYWVTPYYALVRFGRWEKILEEPEPAEDLVYPRGLWHWSRGMAFTRLGKLEKAEEELKHVVRAASDETLDSVTIWDINTTRALMEIARELLAGELLRVRGDYEAAIERLRRGVSLEDALNYDEPPPWSLPVRHFLGAALLEAGRPVEAETVYREDLDRFPANGWSLKGLALSLAVQSEEEMAESVRARFHRAWKTADVKLAASRM